METPLVSISCITYNHGKYLKQCFDGFLMQQTDFLFEVLIHDDASTDETAGIINEYTVRFPGIFKPVIQSENQYSKGQRGMNIKYNFPRALGKYIAICEGDDYWIDPLKLQKQVNFLEENENFSMVCHDAIKINETTNTSTLFFDSTKRKQICSTKDALNNHFCPTASLVFRKEAIFPLSNFDESAAAGDQQMVQLLSLKGLLFRMYDVMSVYRVTGTGASQVNRKYLASNLKNRIKMLNHLNTVSQSKYMKYIYIEKLLLGNRIRLLESKSMPVSILLKMHRKILLQIKRLVLLF